MTNNILGYSILVVRSKQTFLDKVGATASMICAVHCVLTGVALGLLSAMGMGFFANPAVDLTLLVIAVVVGFVALLHGVRKHGSWIPGIFYVLGLMLIVLAHFHWPHLGHENHKDGHAHDAMSTWLSVLGGLSFVGFHVWNMKLQHKHDDGCNCHRPMCEHTHARE